MVRSALRGLAIAAALAAIVFAVGGGHASHVSHSPVPAGGPFVSGVSD